MNKIQKLEAALELIKRGKRKSNIAWAWSFAQEAADIAGVKVFRDPVVDTFRGRPDFERLEKDIRAALMPEVIIVTRHAGAVEWLKEQGIEGEILAHVDNPEKIRGKICIGALPLHLAAEAVVVGTIDLPGLTPEQRGKDLTVQEMINAAAILRWYRVEQSEPPVTLP